jgi:hypothetical protein
MKKASYLIKKSPFVVTTPSQPGEAPVSLVAPGYPGYYCIPVYEVQPGIATILIDDRPLHTHNRPFCTDADCCCHSADQESLDLLNSLYTEGLLTKADGHAIFRGQKNLRGRTEGSSEEPLGVFRLQYEFGEQTREETFSSRTIGSIERLLRKLHKLHIEATLLDEHENIVGAVSPGDFANPWIWWIDQDIFAENRYA